MDGWFGIECPRINFPSLDSSEIEKLQHLHCPPVWYSLRSIDRMHAVKFPIGSEPCSYLVSFTDF